jgi:hypothetical protein
MDMGLERHECGLPGGCEAADSRVEELYAAFLRIYAAWRQKREELRQLRQTTAEEAGLHFDDAEGLHDALVRRRRMSISDFLEREDREASLLAQRGYAELQQEVDGLRRLVGQIANEIFSTPAGSVRGVAPKLQLLRYALGRRGAQEDGDEEFESCQDTAAQPWFDSLAHEIERLAANAESGNQSSKSV